MKLSSIKTEQEFYKLADIWYQRTLKLSAIWKNRKYSEIDRMRAFELWNKMSQRVVKLQRISLSINHVKLNSSSKFPVAGIINK